MTTVTFWRHVYALPQLTTIGATSLSRLAQTHLADVCNLQTLTFYAGSHSVFVHDLIHALPQLPALETLCFDPTLSATRLNELTVGQLDVLLHKLPRLRVATGIAIGWSYGFDFAELQQLMRPSLQQCHVIGFHGVAYLMTQYCADLVHLTVSSCDRDALIDLVAFRDLCTTSRSTNVTPAAITTPITTVTATTAKLRTIELVGFADCRNKTPDRRMQVLLEIATLAGADRAVLRNCKFSGTLATTFALTQPRLKHLVLEDCWMYDESMTWGGAFRS
jgi:hypothetical protein